MQVGSVALRDPWPPPVLPLRVCLPDWRADTLRHLRYVPPPFSSSPSNSYTPPREQRASLDTEDSSPGEKAAETVFRTLQSHDALRGHPVNLNLSLSLGTWVGDGAS